jgi:hypothetical protein
MFTFSWVLKGIVDFHIRGWSLYRVIQENVYICMHFNRNYCFSVCGEAVSSPCHVRVLQWNVLSQGAYMLLWYSDLKGGGGAVRTMSIIQTIHRYWLDVLNVKIK